MLAMLHLFGYGPLLILDEAEDLFIVMDQGISECTAFVPYCHPFFTTVSLVEQLVLHHGHFVYTQGWHLNVFSRIGTMERMFFPLVPGKRSSMSVLQCTHFGNLWLLYFASCSTILPQRSKIANSL